MWGASGANATILCVGVTPAWFRGLTVAGFAVVETWPEVIAVALRQNPAALLVIGDCGGERNLSRVLEALRCEPNPPLLPYFAERTGVVDLKRNYRKVLHAYQWTEDSSLAKEAVLHTFLKGSLTPAS